ncbi:hypothetical protein CBB2_0562 [Clostridium botulinum]|nr:hypothetical protein CBB2_0562 [Clostridium botulinum]
MSWTKRYCNGNLCTNRKKVIYYMSKVWLQYSLELDLLNFSVVFSYHKILYIHHCMYETFFIIYPRFKSCPKTFHGIIIYTSSYDFLRNYSPFLSVYFMLK